MKKHSEAIASDQKVDSNIEDSPKGLTLTIHLPSGAINKIITAVSSEIVTLIIFMLLCFGLFFLYISVSAKIFIPNEFSVDTGGRAVAGIIGISVGLGTAVFSLWYVYHTTIQAEKSQLNVVSAFLLDLLAKERASLSKETSQKILEVIEQLYKTKSEVKPLDIYQKLVDVGIIQKEHHETFTLRVLESDDLF